MIFDRFKAKKGSFSQLGFTSDCHCHILPGVDDGSPGQNESEEMLRAMSALGISSVTLTPHLNPDIYPSNTEPFIRERYQQFIDSLPSDISSSMEVSLGAEYMVTGDFDSRDFSELIQFRPGKVLIEMSYLYVSPNIEQTLFELSMADITPVIAHPERYLYLAGKLHTFERYHDMGAEFQMNLLSLSGVYGPDSLRILKFIQKNGWYSYMGSDAHSTGTVRNISGMKFDRNIL